MRPWDRLGSRIPRFVAASSITLGCASTPNAADRDEFRLQTAPVSYLGVSDTVRPDSAMASLISVYRDQLIVEMSREIGIATAQFDKDRPEGALGNFVADAMFVGHSQSRRRYRSHGGYEQRRTACTYP